MLITALIGFMFGTIRLLFELLKWIVSIAAALTVYITTVDAVMREIPEVRTWYLPVSIFLVFSSVYLFLSVLQKQLLIRSQAKNWFYYTDKVSGIVPGLLLGIFLSAITGRLLTYSAVDQLSREATNSKIAGKLSPYTQKAEEQFVPLIENYISVPFSPNAKSTEEKAENAIPVTTSFYERPDLEYEMLLLVNAERKKAGLPALAADEELRKAARSHSEDMFTRGYFSHLTPDGVGPFQRMKKWGIRYTKAGENLAYASTLEKAHTGLMNSPGHRAAILNTGFTRIGIGIIDAGENGLMISQEFRN